MQAAGLVVGMQWAFVTAQEPCASGSPQSCEGADGKHARSPLWVGRDIIILVRKQICLVPQREMLFLSIQVVCYTNILENSSRTKTIIASAHKIHGNARDPWKMISQEALKIYKPEVIN